ncbi:YoaK family protein [soil metagenome]
MRRYDRPMIAAAIALSALAGFIDALAFLDLKGFFVSFMSGNSTRLGAALAGRNYAAAGTAGSLIGCFVLGVVIASLMGHRAGAHRKPAVLSLVTVTLFVSAALASSGAHHFAVLLLAFAMGAENKVFAREGEVAIGLTYMTGTLVRAGQHFAQFLLRREGWEWVSHVLLWAGFLAGVMLGARSYAALGLGALWIAASASAGLSGVVLLLVRRGQSPRRSGL